MRILTCYNNIIHPGIAKLVSRLVWECRGGVRAGQCETPQSLVTPVFAGFPSIVENAIKAALTT